LNDVSARSCNWILRNSQVYRSFDEGLSAVNKRFVLNHPVTSLKGGSSPNTGTIGISIIIASARRHRVTIEG
jgi:hypothetical protein